MSEPRIPMLDLDAARRAAAAAKVPETMADLSVFRVLLQHPTLAGAVYKLLSMLLWKGSLDGRLRELVIMRIGWRTESVYEWTQHWRVARLMDVSEADLLAVRDWRAADQFGPVERAVLAATDETLDTGSIAATTWEECAQHLPVDALLELVIAIGNWRMFSSLLRSLDVPLEDGIEPWPPDGATP
jgi:alkylhydroperoxidase family enzyme